jgi:hypothetical protein
MFCILSLHFVNYVFLLLFLCILVMFMHSYCYVYVFLLCYVLFRTFRFHCIVLCIVCVCVLYYCQRVSTHLQLAKYIISKPEMFKMSALRKKPCAKTLSAKIPKLKAANKNLSSGIDTKPNTFLNKLLLQDLINQQGILQCVL